jgi:dienelactone hydrolase
MNLRHIYALVHLWILTLSVTAAVQADEPITPGLRVKATVIDGTNPGIQAIGLEPKQTVRIHALRSLEKWRETPGQWQKVRQTMHSYADFEVAADGTVQVDTQKSLQGTYSQVDPLALLRTGYRLGDSALKNVRIFAEDPITAGPENRVWIKLERKGEVIAEAFFELMSSTPGLAVAQKRGDGWHAVYARPPEGKNLPVVISLHGSEGGSIEKARGRALPFASQGFATVAVNYFAYPHEAIQGIPAQHAEIKLEILESIRDWLKTRPEVDMENLYIVGTSKGAEFALLAASKYDWIKSVVAIVPSDIVWEGYGGNSGQGTASSSWSWGGKALPFMPLFQFDPKQEGLYRTNTERYERSRTYYADKVAAARIPVEMMKARLLLLASDRDEVWASGAMARNIVERLSTAGKGSQVEVKIYPKAGHQISGSGTFPVRLYGEQSPDPEAKDLLAEGEAAADAWNRTLKFLKK